MKRFNISCQLQHFAKKTITPLKIEFIHGLGQKRSSKNIIEQSRFLHNELSIRLSHRVYNLFNLPYGLPLVPEITKVINLYGDSFDKIQETPLPICYSSAESFTYIIKEIKDSHNLLEEIIGNALQNIPDPFVDYSLINRELDDFFMSRIGIRTLISQQVESVLYGGSIISDCDVSDIMKCAIKDVQGMAMIKSRSEIPPRITLINSSKNTMRYIPSHLYYIFIEVLKNSVVAHQSINEVTEAINISITEGDDDFIIKVSDRGGGFIYKDTKKALSYSYSTSPKINSIRDSTSPILSGLGFGLPLSRQYCRYFGGDLNINPTEGVGTDVHIYIHKLGTQAEKII